METKSFSNFCRICNIFCIFTNISCDTCKCFSRKNKLNYRAMILHLLKNLEKITFSLLALQTL